MEYKWNIIKYNNLLFKFADDTYLIVGSSRLSDVLAELIISKWAKNNNLRLNTETSKEMIISRKFISTINRQVRK